MGPWSRSFIAAVAGNAERPDLEVTDLRIEPGVISARVDGCEVTLTAAPIPQRIWTAMTRYAKGMGQLEDAVDGRVQSVHLEHLLEEDWGEQLIPRPRAIVRVCSCDERAGCGHVAAVAHCVAEKVEHTPRFILHWRGVGGGDDSRTASPESPWQGAQLDRSKVARPMPTHAVAKRLGPSGVAVSAGEDLEVALRRAYDAFVSTGAAFRGLPRD
jgi:uncharacterized Zn finger protein